jgi:nicotinamide mononucleotide (NMN) deamidase PncC
MGQNIWGADDMTMEGEIGRLLKASKMTLAVSETFTGGLLVCSLTGAPEVRACFRGGIVLPVSAGEACVDGVLKRAGDVRKQFHADVSLAIDGYYETTGQTGGGHAYITATVKSNRDYVTVDYPGKLSQVARRTVNHALVFLINSLK